MAFVGLRHVVAATIATEVEGQALTYDAGKVIGKAIEANLSWNRNDNPLYADDAIAENDNGITGGSLELNVDDLTDEVRAYLLGDATEGTGTDLAYIETDDAAPYVGVGYIRVRRKNGETSYQGVWIYKAQFAQESEDAQTKGESIEWQTPTINGTIFGVTGEVTGKTAFRERKTFTTYTAAETWLDSKAGL